MGTIIGGGCNGDFRQVNCILNYGQDYSLSNCSNDIYLANVGVVDGINRISAVPLGNPAELIAYVSDIPKSHGNFYSTISQSQATSNTPHVFTYNGSNNVVGLTETAGKIYSTNGGTYTVTFSIQFARTSGGTATIAEAWLRIGGTDEPNTNTRILLASGGNGEAVLTVPVNFDLIAGQYFEIVMGTPDYTNTIAQAISARTTPYVAPAIPSIIVTIEQVG